MLIILRRDIHLAQHIESKIRQEQRLHPRAALSNVVASRDPQVPSLPGIAGWRPRQPVCSPSSTSISTSLLCIANASRSSHPMFQSRQLRLPTSDSSIPIPIPLRSSHRPRLWSEVRHHPHRASSRSCSRLGFDGRCFISLPAGRPTFLLSKPAASPSTPPRPQRIACQQQPRWLL